MRRFTLWDCLLSEHPLLVFICLVPAIAPLPYFLQPSAGLHSSWLLQVSGALVFVPAMLHVTATLRDIIVGPKYFLPVSFVGDENVRATMEHSGIALDHRVNLWRAWLGFNLTHGLGLATLGALVAVMSDRFLGDSHLLFTYVGVSFSVCAISRLFFFF